MVDMDREFEAERDRGAAGKRKPKTRIRGSEIEAEQMRRIARSREVDATEKPGFNRWTNT